MNPKNLKILAVLFPVLALGAMVTKNLLVLQTAETFIFDITGYDPRDLLSGHYLTYQIVFPGSQSNYCATSANWGKEAYFCMDEKQFHEGSVTDCERAISGKCNYSRFETGLERFYIPESNARSLDQAIREKKAQIMVSVPKSGKAIVKDLLIEGKSWIEYSH